MEKVLKKFIKQNGSCNGILCTECPFKMMAPKKNHNCYAVATRYACKVRYEEYNTTQLNCATALLEVLNAK